MSTPPTLADSLIVPSDLGQGGANLSEGTPKLAEIMKAWDTLLRGFLTSDVEGLGLDSIGIIHERDFVPWFDPETVHSAMDALIVTKQRVEETNQLAFGANAASFKRKAAFVQFDDLEQPSLTTFSFFDDGDPMPSGARFLALHFRLITPFDNAAHSAITASIGIVEDPTAVSATFDLTDAGNTGKTVLGVPGSMAVFLSADISEQVISIQFASANNLDTLTAGQLAVDLFYTTP